MPVWLRNFQRSVLFNEHMFKMRCCFLLNVFDAGRFDTSIICVSNKRMQQLNLKYRNQDTPTDVLSFPYHENLIPGSRLPVLERECDFNLGDIILNMPYISSECKEEGAEFMDRLTILVTHGMCHLLGYTHDTETEIQQVDDLCFCSPYITMVLGVRLRNSVWCHRPGSVTTMRDKSAGTLGPYNRTKSAATIAYL